MSCGSTSILFYLSRCDYNIICCARRLILFSYAVHALVIRNGLLHVLNLGEWPATSRTRASENPCLICRVKAHCLGQREALLCCPSHHWMILIVVVMDLPCCTSCMVCCTIAREPLTVTLW